MLGAGATMAALLSEKDIAPERGSTAGSKHRPTAIWSFESTWSILAAGLANARRIDPDRERHQCKGQ